MSLSHECRLCGAKLTRTFVDLGMSPLCESYVLQERLDGLWLQLAAVSDAPRVLAAVHVVPFRELLPPPRNPQWDFAKAYLGSERIGRLLLEFPNVRHVLCGHSHFPAHCRVGQIEAVNIGSGYRWKTAVMVEV